MSTALSGRGRVSDATRQRIRTIAQELGYEVNVGARNLRQSRTGSIGLYLPDSAASLAYYMDFAFGAVEAARQQQLALTLIPPRGPLDVMPHVDGVIVVDVSDRDSSARAILSGRRPVVSGELVPADLPQPAASVYTDHRAAMQQLLEHLRSAGGTDFAVMAPPIDTQWGRDVQQTCRDWARAHRLPLRLIETDFSPGVDRVSADAEAALTDTAVDAMVAVPDGAALIALSAARRIGRRIGKDLLLASYVDNPLLLQADPSITAVDLAPRDFGSRCALMLMRLIDPSDAGDPQSERFPVTLRTRASSSFEGRKGIAV